MVKKYIVSVTVKFEVDDIEVWAESEEEAKEEAYIDIEYEFLQSDCTFQVREVGELTDIAPEVSPLDEIIEVGLREAMLVARNHLPIGKYLAQDRMEYFAVHNTDGKPFSATFATKDEAIAWLNRQTEYLSNNSTQECRKEE